jgi:hypothetical protein
MDAPMRDVGKRFESELSLSPPLKKAAVEATPDPLIFKLPNEILTAIFSYIPKAEKVISARVCKLFAGLLPEDRKVTRAVAFAAARCGSLNLLRWFQGEVDPSAPKEALGKVVHSLGEATGPFSPLELYGLLFLSIMMRQEAMI